MEGLGPSLNIKVIRVRTWFGYIDQLQGRWPVRITKTGGNRAKYIVGSLPSPGAKLATFAASSLYNQSALSP